MVEAWLDATGDEPCELSPQEVKKMETVIWQTLSGKIRDKGTPARVIAIRRGTIRYAVAVCAIIVMVTGTQKVIDKQLPKQPVGCENANDIGVKQVKTAEMDLLLLPHSKAYTRYGSPGSGASLVVRGAMALTSKLDGDAPYTISTEDGASRMATLRKNVPYYIFISKDARTGKEKINTYDKQGILLYYNVRKMPKDVLVAVMNPAI